MLLRRLQRIHSTFIVVSALLGGLSLAVLSFDEFHPTETDINHAAEGLLCASALGSVVSVMISTMLLFKFEGHESGTYQDLAIAWSPLVILDAAIVEYFFGVLLWYAGKNNRWRTTLMSAHLVILILFSIWVAAWMWRTRDVERRLGKEEM